MGTFLIWFLSVSFLVKCFDKSVDRVVDVWYLVKGYHDTWGTFSAISQYIIYFLVYWTVITTTTTKAHLDRVVKRIKFSSHFTTLTWSRVKKGTCCCTTLIRQEIDLFQMSKSHVYCVSTVKKVITKETCSRNGNTLKPWHTLKDRKEKKTLIRVQTIKQESNHHFIFHFQCWTNMETNQNRFPL